MKYLTKEWYKMYRQSIFDGHYIHVTKKAEVFDEKLFQRIYKKIEERYIAASAMRISSKDEFEKALAKIMGELDDPKLSQKEREKLQAVKELFIKMHEQEEKEAQEYADTFDEEKAKKSFAGWYEGHLKTVETFPQAILSQVADKRVLALGYATKEVKKLVNFYACEQGKKADELWGKALDMVDEAEKNMDVPASLNIDATGILYGVRKVKDGLLLKFKDIHDIHVINGVITKQEQKINRFIENKHFSPMTIMIGKELEFIDCKYRLSLLLDNVDEQEHYTTWEMVVEGDDLYWSK